MFNVHLIDSQANLLAEGLEMLIEQHRHAKDHLLKCPSVESPEMLLDVASDYDAKIAAYVHIKLQLQEQES